jgi:hypothetical protein
MILQSDLLHSVFRRVVTRLSGCLEGLGVFIFILWGLERDFCDWGDGGFVIVVRGRGVESVYGSLCCFFVGTWWSGRA